MPESQWVILGSVSWKSIIKVRVALPVVIWWWSNKETQDRACGKSKTIKWGRAGGGKKSAEWGEHVVPKCYFPVFPFPRACRYCEGSGTYRDECKFIGGFTDQRVLITSPPLEMGKVRDEGERERERGTRIVNDFPPVASLLDQSSVVADVTFMFLPHFDSGPPASGTRSRRLKRKTCPPTQNRKAR